MGLVSLQLRYQGSTDYIVGSESCKVEGLVFKLKGTSAVIAASIRPDDSKYALFELPRPFDFQVLKRGGFIDKTEISGTIPVVETMSIQAKIFQGIHEKCEVSVKMSSVPKYEKGNLYVIDVVNDERTNSLSARITKVYKVQGTLDFTEADEKELSAEKKERLEKARDRLATKLDEAAQGLSAADERGDREAFASYKKEFDQISYALEPIMVALKDKRWKAMGQMCDRTQNQSIDKIIEGIKQVNLKHGDPGSK